MTRSAAPDSRGTTHDQTVELWYSRCGAATASAIALRKNWLQAEFSRGGTILQSLRDSEDGSVRDSHYHHQISGLFREGGNIPPIWARANGQETAVIGITWLDEYQGILSRADSGIREIGDLICKRLALPLNRNLIDFQRGAALHGFVTALGLAGAKADDAQFVDVLPTERVEGAQNGDVSAGRGNGGGRGGRGAEVDALLEGRVDAIFLRFARGARLARDPRFHQVININEQADPLTRVNNGTPRPVTVGRAFLERHPDIVARYLAVLLRTASWAEQHPQEVLELLSSEGGEASVQDVLDSHGPLVHRSFTPRLTPEFIKGLETQKNFLRDFKFLKGDFDAQAWVVREPLAEAERLVRAEPRLYELPAEPQTAAPTVRKARNAQTVNPTSA
jgi:ABC-type nitrate/sulfonate/bicarbonate transport system substrate-binding protein